MHPLTTKLGIEVDKIILELGKVLDKAVKDYLNKAAKELKSGSWDINRSHIVDKILGLTSETVEKCPHPGTCEESEKKVSAKEWKCLNCNYWFDINTHFLFCGMCGSARPKKPSIKEQLAEKFATINNSKIIRAYLPDAEVAIQFFSSRLLAKDNALKYALMWHSGNGTAEAEQACIEEITKGIEA